MAEALMATAAEREGFDIEVTSSGTWAIDGEPAAEGAIEAMRGRRIDLTTHRSRPFDAAEGRESDLIVAMTSVHLREIEAAMPGSAAKTRLLKELTEITFDGGPTSAARLDALLQAPRPTWVRRFDLDDPMGLPLGAYEFCAGELEGGVERLIDVLR